jgi:hypothetical protein
MLDIVPLSGTRVPRHIPHGQEPPFALTAHDDLFTARKNRAGASKLIPDTPRTIQEEDARVERIYQDWLDTQAAEYEREIHIPHGQEPPFALTAHDDLFTARKTHLTLVFCGLRIEPILAPRTIQEEDARVERIYQDWLDTQAAEYEREMSLSGGEQVVNRANPGRYARPWRLPLVSSSVCPG